MELVAFDRWVADNNIPPTFEYSKGWWDYVELVRRFADHLDTDDVRVIGHISSIHPRRASAFRCPPSRSQDRG